MDGELKCPAILKNSFVASISAITRIVVRFSSVHLSMTSPIEFLLTTEVKEKEFLTTASKYMQIWFTKNFCHSFFTLVLNFSFQACKFSWQEIFSCGDILWRDSSLWLWTKSFRSLQIKSKIRTTNILKGCSS